MMKTKMVVSSNSKSALAVVGCSLKLCSLSMGTKDMVLLMHRLESLRSDESLVDYQPVLLCSVWFLRKKARRKTSVSNMMTVGAGALSIQKLR